MSSTTRARKTTSDTNSDLQTQSKNEVNVVQKLTDDGQLTKTINVLGNGSVPPKGSLVKVNYIGKLPNGTIFDSSYNQGAPFEFKLGAGHVIAGWDQGIATMRVGEKAILSCGSKYAYGENGINDGATLIPPHATLNFEVELLSWKEDNALPLAEISLVFLILALAWYLLYFEPSQRTAGASH